MPRYARKDIKTPFLHVMVQGVNKEYIFYDDKHIENYLEIIRKNKKDCEFTIISYCVMNNHAHFLIYTEDIVTFGKFMQKTNLNYAQKYNKEENRYGVLFRNRYQVEPIYDKKYLINCIKYIHENPVKAGIVRKCKEYKYSSYNNYINNVGESQSKIMVKLFGKDCDYKALFEKPNVRRFMDNAEDNDNLKEDIKEGITQFIKENHIKPMEIYSKREVLKKLIYFLKDSCNFKYIEIRNYLEIPRGTMDTLKIR